MALLTIDAGVILLACVFPVYIMIDKLTGFISVITYSISYYFSLMFFQQYVGKEVIFGIDHFWFIVYLKAFSWIMQFIGHGVFEK